MQATASGCADAVQLDPQKIAIIIPTYNASRTVMRAINSALAQVVPAPYSIGVIAVDDQSTDKTWSVLQQAAQDDPRLTVLQMPQNGGPSAARNLALSATNAGWFTPLDCDDYLAPDRLATLIDIACSGDWDVVADNLLMTTEDTPAEVVRNLWPGKPAGLFKLTLERFVRQNLASDQMREELGFLKPLINRARLGVGPAYRSDMRFAEDYELYTRLLSGGARACLVDPAGYYAVQRASSLSSSQRAGDFARLVDVDRQLLNNPSLSGPARRAVRAHLRETQSEWAWLRAIEAVKARKPLAFLSCFLVSWSASMGLIQKLLEQVFVRTARVFQRSRSQVSPS